MARGINPAFGEKNIPIAFASDGAFLPYLMVAIDSAIAHTTSGNLDILVMQSGLDSDAMSDFTMRYAGMKNVSVRFVDASASRHAGRFSAFKKGGFPVTACYRLVLPDLLPSYDKIMYLDVDTVVCRDLGELFSQDISGSLFAAAKDEGIERFLQDRPEYAAFAEGHGFSSWQTYVNSGVLLMNLKGLRSDGLSDRLLDIAMDDPDWFCDQDAINFICKGKIKLLDARWNVQLGVADVRRRFASGVECPFILHYSGPQKPWARPEHQYAHLWWNHVRLEDGARMWRNISSADEPAASGDGVAATVVVSFASDAPFLRECLFSLAAQTLKNIEVICVDIGATDGSREICNQFSKLDGRFRIVEEVNNVAVARNRGLNEASGRWVLFAEGDSYCRSDTLEEMVRKGEDGAVDMVVSGRSRLDMTTGGFYEMPIPHQYLELHSPVNCRTSPLGSIHRLGISTSGKLYRRDYLVKNSLVFCDDSSRNEVYFPLVAFLKSSCMAFVKPCLQCSRIRRPDVRTLPDVHATKAIEAFEEARKCVPRDATELKKMFLGAAVVSCLDGFFALKTEKGRRTVFGALRKRLPAMAFSSADMESAELGAYRPLYKALAAGCDMSTLYALKLDLARDDFSRMSTAFRAERAKVAVRDEKLAAAKEHGAKIWSQCCKFKDDCGTLQKKVEDQESENARLQDERRFLIDQRDELLNNAEEQKAKEARIWSQRCRFMAARDALKKKVDSQEAEIADISERLRVAVDEGETLRQDIRDQKAMEAKIWAQRCRFMDERNANARKVRALEETISSLLSSKDYRLGRWLMYPLRSVSRIFKSRK